MKVASETFWRIEQVPKFILWLIPLIVLWVSNLTLYADLFDKAFLFNALVDLAWLTFLLLLLFRRIKIQHFRLNLIDLLLSGFVVALLLAALLAYDPLKSFLGIFWRTDSFYHWLHYLLFYWLLRLTFQSVSDWLIWLRANTASAGLLSLGIVLVALRQFLLTGAKLTYTVGSLGNFNFLAYYLALSLVLAFGLYLFDTRFRWRLFYLLSFLLQLYPLWLTSGRTAYLAFAIGLALLLGVKLWSSLRWRRYLPLLFLFFLLLLGGLMLGGGGVSRFKTSFKEPALVHRWEAWQIAWQAFQARPLFGWGTENFSAAFNHYYRPVFEDISDSNETWFDKAHNIFVEYLVVGGLAAFLVLVSLFLALFASVFQSWRCQRLKAGERTLLYLGLVGLVVYFGLNLLGFDTVASSFIAIALFALVASLRKEVPKGKISLKKDQLSVRRWALLVPAVFLLWGSWQYTFSPWLIERAAARELREIKKDTLEEEFAQIEAWLKKSSFIRRNFLPYIPLALHQNWVKLGSFSEEEKRKKLWPVVIDLLSRYQDDLVKEPTSLLSLALPLMNDIEADETALRKARQILEEILSLNPNRPFLYYYLANLAAKRGEREKSRVLLLQALHLNDRFDLARYQLILLEWAEGDKERGDFLAGELTTPWLLMKLAEFYAQNRELSRLAGIYQRLLEQNPQDILTRHRLGLLYVEMGELEQARQEAEMLKKIRSSAEAVAGGYQILQAIESKEGAL